MCGIAGFFRFHDREVEDPTVCDRMLNRISYRGPDDSGLCGIGVDNQLYPVSKGKDFEVRLRGVFGFNRLSIQDLSSNGHQPMLSRDKKVCLTFNGEIYNVKELRHDLQKEGMVFQSNSDTEVILNLYLMYGIDSLCEKLNGMFAIVLYDSRLHRIFLCRDRFGIIPLYYHFVDDAVVWCSEIKCLLEYPKFVPRLSREELYKSFSYCYPNVILYDGVHAVEPGTYLSVNSDCGDTKCVRYYEMIQGLQSNYTSIEEAADAAEQIFRRCVRRQLISDVSLGVQLSGGVDSTLVAKYASEVYTELGSKLWGFSHINTRSNEHNEDRWINHATTKIDINPVKVDITDTDFTRDLKLSTYHYERFVNDPSPIAVLEFTREAKKKCTVLLSGEGADELCGGYHDYVRLREEEEKHLGTENVVTDGYLLAFNRQCDERICRDLIYGFNHDQVLLERRNIWNKASGSLFQKNRLLFFDCLLIGLLEKQNKICMANSIENRVPFLDNEFVDFIMTLPDEFLIHPNIRGGIKLAESDDKYIGKYILKVLSERVFGHPFAYRKKQYIRVPIVEYFKGDVFRKYLDNQIIKSMGERDIVNMDNFKNILDNLNLNNVMGVWKAINTEIWCQMFLDRSLPEAL